MHENIVIRDMRPGEEMRLLRAARQAFVHSPMEQIGISKPKSALVVEVDGALAGAMFLRIFESGGRKTGYLDVGFVMKPYRGRGIGRALYPAAAARLRELGCDPIAAMVIDDNVASWKSLENQGFGTPTLTELARRLGLGRALSFWLRTLLCIASGTRLWMSGPVRPRSSAQEMGTFFGLNMILFLPRLLQLTARPDRLVLTLIAYPALLLAGVLFGAVGCLVAGGAWRFDLPRGGALITLIANSLGSVFPMVGRWYPKEPRATRECRRAMGLQAVVEWLGMMALFALGAFAFADNAFLGTCSMLMVNLLLCRMLPFMPFGAFGGGRVWGWNKFVFATMAAATVAVVYLAF